MSFQGTAQAFEDSSANLWMLLVLAIVVIYIVLGILYESFVHPLTILSGLPSAGLGALRFILLCPRRSRISTVFWSDHAHRYRQEKRDHDDRLCPRC